MRSSFVALLLVLIANVSEAAITFQGWAATGIDTASRGTYQAWSITPGGIGAASGDVCVLDGSLDGKISTASWPTISATGGQTWNILFQSQTSTYARARYWTTFNGTWSGGVVTITSTDVPNGAFAITGALACFHPTNSSNTWSVDVATSQAEYSAPGGSCDVTITGQTPTASASVITIATWMGHGDDVWTLQTAGWTNPNSVTQIRNSYGGSNLSISQAYKIQTSAAATGNVTNRQSVCSAGWTAITTFKETSGGGGGSGFVNRFMGFFRGAFAHNLGGGGGGGGPGTGSMKWNPGYYGDCNQDGAAPFISLGNVNHDLVKSCIDYYAAAGGMTGVFIKCSWTCFEGDAPGSYDGSVGNSMGGAGTIGHPLWDSILAYAANAGMKVQVGIEWFSQGTPSCTFPYPAYLVGTGGGFCGGGTDSAGTYGITVTPDGLVWVRIWKAAVMDRFIAMVSDFGARYNGNTTLDAISILWDDSSFTGGDPGPDGFTFTNLVTQLSRFAPAVRGAAPNTGFYAMVNFMPMGDTANLFAAFGSSANHMFYAEQDAVVWETTDGDHAYLGYVGWGSHDYRGEIPMAIRLSQTTQCTHHDSYAAHNGLPASSNTTPAQYYDYWFTSGKTDASGKPLGPSQVLLSRIIGAECSGVASQQFTGTGGWLEFLQSNPLNTTRPTTYP